MLGLRAMVLSIIVGLRMSVDEIGIFPSAADLSIPSCSVMALYKFCFIIIIIIRSVIHWLVKVETVSVFNTVLSPVRIELFAR